MTKRPHSSPQRNRSVIQASLGLLLIGGSVWGVTSILESQSATRALILTSADARAGVTFSEVSVETVEVPENLTAFPPLTDADIESLAGMVTTRALRAGEPISKGDFAYPHNRDFTAVTIALAVGEPPWLEPGQRVSLWVAPPASENSFSAPFVLSANALIESVGKEEGFAADTTTRQVNLMIAHRDVPGVIHALANKYFVHLVPVPPSP
jgi:hypothetical protein